MNTKIIIQRFVLLFTGLMLISSSTIFAQERGYWKLIEIEPRARKEQLGENVKFYVEVSLAH